MTTEPTQSIDDAMVDWNNKHHPPVPEPSTYGLVFAGLCLMLVVIKKFKTR